MEQIYDVIVLGGGPGGYTAALYTTRAGLSTLVLEKLSIGGQMTQTAQIDNYPGFEEGIDGFTLGMKMQAGAERFGARTELTEILSVDLATDPKLIRTDSGDYYAKAVIIATGAEHKHLGLENEEMLIGRGVGYCAACDGMLYRNKTVCIVGGGNTAVGDALLLSRICKKVYLIHRRDSLRAAKISQDALFQAENVELKWNAVPEKLLFDKKLTAVQIVSTADDRTEVIPCDGLFISIGQAPNTGLFEGQLDLQDGYVLADESTRTSLPGVFAVGDVRTKPVRQVVTAAADGAVAAHFAEEYLTEKLTV